MSDHRLSRREFLRGSAFSAGIILASACSKELRAQKAAKTAADQVALGGTGVRLSRLGIGTGTNSGSLLRGLGREKFNDLIRYAFDKGITYFDTADSYQTHTWVRDAIRGLPREKLYIQSKMTYAGRFGNSENPSETLDRFRKELNVDYIDTVLIHCQIDPNWDEQSKALRDALDQAKQKRIIRAHGVSCHSLPATKKAAELDWVDVNLVRINPQGANMDTQELAVFGASNASHVPAVVEQLKVMKKNGHGVIGMKLIGEGKFKNIADRKKSLAWVMRSNIVDAVVIGLKSRKEIDETILHINNAFAD
jgi:predicted aldo/keto reductase-like oxidoreductase